MRRFAVVLAAIAALVVVNAPAASASPYKETTISCGSFQNPESGTAHARIRSCQVYFWKDLDGNSGHKVTFQFLDASTDGKCAWARDAIWDKVGVKECNGAWKNYAHSDSFGVGNCDYAHIFLWYAKSDDPNREASIATNRIYDNPFATCPG